MKKFLIILALFPFLNSTAISQNLKPIDEKSEVLFKVAHTMIFRSTVTGTIKGLKGSIVFDQNSLPGCSFDVSVEVSTLSSGIGMRDKDLKKEKYFDVQHYPTISIKSTEITKGSKENQYILSGKLTIKGKTSPVSFPFTANKTESGYIFKGLFHVNRLDFNVGPDNSIDKDVEVDLSVTAQ